MRLRVIAILGAVALATTASAQVLNEKLSSEAVLSGEATKRLEDIGRRAAEADLVLQVNAPDLWEAEILTPVRRGAGDKRLEIKFVNTMSETVVIRGVKAGENEDPLETLKRITNNAKARSIQAEEEAEAASQPAPGQQSSEPASNSRPDIERPKMDVPEVRVERPQARLPEADARESSRKARGEGGVAQSPAPAPAAQESAAAARAAEATEERGVATGEQDAAESRAVDEAAADEEAERFERLYNNGRSIRRTIRPGELEAGDLVFRGNYHDVVVRRGISTDAFWLDGDIPEERLEHENRNRYAVASATPEAKAADTVEAPSGEAAERQRFERLYNGGRAIDESVAPGELKRDDELYVGDSVIVVLRRSRVSIDAYWLAQPVDLDQPAIEHAEKNKYVVVGRVK